MKETIKRFFFLISLSSSVLGCTLSVGSTLIQDNHFQIKLLFGTGLVFFAISLFLFFKNGKSGLISLALSLGAISWISLSFGGINGGDCGSGAVEMARQGAIVAVGCSLFQTITYFIRKKQSELT